MTPSLPSTGEGVKRFGPVMSPKTVRGRQGTDRHGLGVNP